MKTFHNRSLHWINCLLSGLLGLLGFSCDGIGETPDEYGTPWATYQFRGRVLDASNQPIGNLRVKAIPANDDMAPLRTGYHPDRRGRRFPDRDGRFPHLKFRTHHRGHGR